MDLCLLFWDAHVCCCNVCFFWINLICCCFPLNLRWRWCNLDLRLYRHSMLMTMKILTVFMEMGLLWRVPAHPGTDVHLPMFPHRRGEAPVYSAHLPKTAKKVVCSLFFCIHFRFQFWSKMKKMGLEWWLIIVVLYRSILFLLVDSLYSDSSQ